MHMSRNLVLPYEIPFKTPIVLNLPGIGIQGITAHTISHPIETLHRVPHTTSPLAKSFVALKAPEPILLPLCAVKAPLPVFAIP